MAQAPAWYNQEDKDIFKNNQFITQKQYRLGPYSNIQEDEDEGEVTETVGIPYTKAFTQSTGDGPGQVPLGLTYDPNAVAKGPASGKYPITESSLKKGTSLQYEWPGEKEYVPSYITDQNLQDTYTGSTAYPVWDDKFQSTKDYWANRVLSADEQAFFDKKKAEFSLPEDEEKESWYSSLFAPRTKGTLGTRSKAQYERGQKLPSIFAAIAGANSAFNPKSRNYNPMWEHQLNFLEMQDKVGIDPLSGLRKYGPESVLSGKNVFSLFGSNDYEEALEKQKAWFENRIAAGKKISWTKYQKLLDEEKILEDKQKNIDDKTKSVAKTIRPQHHKDVSGGGVEVIKGDASTLKGGQGDYTTPSIHKAPKKHTAPSKTGHMGPGGIHYAQGGRAGFFKGALADTEEGKAMSPGTSAGGEFRGGGDNEPPTKKKLSIVPTYETKQKWNALWPTGVVGFDASTPLGRLKAKMNLKNYVLGDDVEPQIDYTKNIGNFNLGATTDLDNYNLSATYDKGPFTLDATIDDQGNKYIGGKLSWKWGGEDGGLVSIL